MSQHSIKIAVSGTHCSGKTRLIQALEKEWVSSKPLSCAIISEVARHCPLPIGPSQSIESSLWIAMTGITRELVAESNSDIIIVDRPVLDVWAYAKIAHPALMRDIADPKAKLIRETIIAWMPTYDIVIASVLDPSIPIKNDQARNLDSGFRLRIAEAMNETYSEFSIDTIQFRSGDLLSGLTDSLDVVIRRRIEFQARGANTDPLERR